MPMSAEIREILMQREPGAAIARALDALLEHDDHLFRVDANERSLTHRFGMYLQAALPDWHVDCEYNRNGPDPKRVVLGEWLVDIADTDGKTAYPDVIAHVRDTDRNYLVLEFKKTSSRAGDHDDFAKLDAYKHDPRLRYAFAIFIELQVGERPGVSRAVWFDRCASNGRTTRWQPVKPRSRVQSCAMRPASPRPDPQPRAWPATRVSRSKAW